VANSAQAKCKLKRFGAVTTMVNKDTKNALERIMRNLIAFGFLLVFLVTEEFVNEGYL